MIKSIALRRPAIPYCKSWKQNVKTFKITDTTQQTLPIENHPCIITDNKQFDVHVSDETCQKYLFQWPSFSINLELQRIFFAEIPLAMSVRDGSYNGNLEMKQDPMDQVDFDDVKAENITSEDAVVNSQHSLGDAQLEKFGEQG